MRNILPLSLLVVACSATVDTKERAATPSEPQQPVVTTPPDVGAVPPAPPIVPPQPRAPYAGNITTNDVSILYPLPSVGDGLVSPSAIGNYGPLLSEASFKAQIAPSLDRTIDPSASNYQAIRVVGVRFDCRQRDGRVCMPQVRLVYQGVYTPNAGTIPEAADGALHATYELSDIDELRDMEEEVLTLKAANSDVSSETLAVHPILSAQGLSGPFAQGLRNILLSHLGDARLIEMTSFDHNMEPDADGWEFHMSTRVAGAWTRSILPTTTLQSQMVVGSGFNNPDQAISNGFIPLITPNAVDALLGRTASSPEQRAQAYDNAVKIQNPDIHTFHTVDCANCHMAESARRVGERDFGFVPGPQAFASTMSLARVDENRGTNNLHAFGYMGRNVSIMQRTANESVKVTLLMRQLLQGAK